MFYEGNGKQGRSGVLVFDPQTGATLKRRDLPYEYFGEGIVDWGPYIYEWTWTSRLCFVYDLQLVKQFTYGGEGWGMTRTANELITSDGTATSLSRPGNFSGNQAYSREGRSQDHQPAQ